MATTGTVGEQRCEIRLERSPGGARLAVSGDLEWSATAELLNDAGAAESSPQLVIDLTDVRRIDSAGTGALVATILHEQRAHKHMAIVACGKVAQVLESVGIAQVVPVVPTIEAARVSLSEAPDRPDAPEAAEIGKVYEELSPGECLAHLAAGRIGRLAGVVDGRPFIFPVNYVLDGATIVFRADAGTALAGAGFGWVAFEIDGVDHDEQTGWSILVRGLATEITDALDHRSRVLRALDVQPWVPGEKGHWVAIQADSITGRRLRAADAVAGTCGVPRPACATPARTGH